MGTKTIFSVSEIAKAKKTGKTTQTVRRELKKRNASTQMKNKSIYVDLSELLRIYDPDELNFNILNGDSNKTDDSEQPATSPKKQGGEKYDLSTKVQVIEEQLNSSKKQIDLLEKQINRERELVEDMKSALEKSQDSQNRTTLMLEHYTKNDSKSDFENVVGPLIKRIDEQERKQKSQIQTELKKRRDLEKSIGVFKITFAAIIIMILVGLFMIYGKDYL